MTLNVDLHGSFPARYLDINFAFGGAVYGATLEGAAAREGHCASRLALLDTAIRNPDGWFDVPLSDSLIEASTLSKALSIILREHFGADLAAYQVILTS